MSAVLAQQAAVTRNSPFQAIQAPVVAEDTISFSIPVPDFEARDLRGRTWRSADLHGKLTIVQIWGTYCLPCRQEHPALQDFFGKERSLKNVQVLTFSLDDDPNRVQAYMKEKGYTFPVIVDRNLEPKLFPSVGTLPKSWVIGPNGYRADPFNSWTFGRVLMEVEKMAKAN
jgi:peroxiredoxin